MERRTLSELQRLEIVLEVVSGERTVEEIASREGLEPSELRAWQRLYAAGARDGLGQARRGLGVSANTQLTARRLKQASWATGLVAVLALCLWTRSALSQAGCAQTLPLPLVTLCVGAPARATDVNGNFQQLVSWVEAKVGAPLRGPSGTGTNNVTVGGTLGVTGATTLSSTLAVTGAATMSSSLTTSGIVRVNHGAGSVGLTGSWQGLPDQGTGISEISSDTGTYKTLMIVGNKSAGGTRSVSVWDKLTVNGPINVAGAVQQNGSNLVRAVTACCGGNGNCCPSGYTWVNVDLNSGAGGSFCYVCVDYAD